MLTSTRNGRLFIDKIPSVKADIIFADCPTNKNYQTRPVYVSGIFRFSFSLFIVQNSVGVEMMLYVTILICRYKQYHYKIT